MMNTVLSIPLKLADKNRYRVEKLILSECQVSVNEVEAATRLARCQIHQFIRKLGF